MTVQWNRRELLLAAAAFIPTLLAKAKDPGSKGSSGDAAEAIGAIEKSLGGRLGIAAWQTGTEKRIEHRSGERFPMCSTFKFLAVAAVLLRVDKKEDKLDRIIRYTKNDLLSHAPITKQHVQEGMTVSSLCAAALQYSDNTAANLLLASLGGPDHITRYARLLGDPVTRLDRNEPTLNTAIKGDVRDTTTPSAMLDDMRKLLIEEGALSARSRNQLREWIIGNTTGSTMLRAGLPSGSTNDIAICWPPNRQPILITAYFVGSLAPDKDCDAAIAKVGEVVANGFAG